MADAQLRAVITAEDRASKVIAQVGGSLDGIKGKLENAVSASQKVALGLAGFAVAAGGAAAKGVQVAGQLEMMRQGFVTLLGSAEAADKTMNRIKQEAARTPFELPGLTAATQALALVTKDGDKAINVLLDVGKALATAGKGQAELDRIIANLQQIALTGQITEMDIRQFGMSGVNILELLAEYYGTTTDKAGDMVKNSKDAFGDLSKAFQQAGAEGGKFAKGFENQAGTFQQIWSNLMDTINVKLAEFVTTTGIFDAVKNAINRVIEVLPVLLSNIEKTITFFREHKELLAVVAGVILGALAPAIYAAAVAFGTLALSLAPFIIGGAIIGGVVAGILWIINHWDLISAKTREIWNSITSYLSNTWNSIKDGIVNAWNGIKDWLVNTWNGLSDSARGWLVILGTIFTGGLLAVALLIYKYWDEIKATTFAIWESISGFFSMIWNAILNVMIPPLNSIAGFLRTKWTEIRNGITSAWNGIKDFFSEVWEGIKEVFSSAVDWIMAKLQPLLNAIDAVKRGAASIGGAIGGAIGSIGNSAGRITGVNDAIISPNGNIITTHPDDYLIATKNPSSLLGKGGITINITGNNFVGREGIAEQISNDIMRALKREVLL